MSALEKFPRITPFLWFNSNAEEAVDFHISIFKNSRRVEELPNVDDSVGPKGSILTLAFELDGQKFTALNGDAAHEEARHRRTRTRGAILIGHCLKRV